MTTDKMTSSRKITKAQEKHAKKVSADKCTKKRELATSKSITSRRKIRKVTNAQEKHSKKETADKRSRKRELAASKALKTIFYDANGKLQRAILENGSPPSVVYMSNKGSLTRTDVEELWDLIPTEFLKPEIVNPVKGFIRKTFNDINNANNGPEFIKKIVDVIRPLLTDDEGNGVYYFPDTAAPLHMIISRGNNQPMHQDKMTGQKVYEKSYEKDEVGSQQSCGNVYTKPCHGLRVLVDLGSFEGHKPRHFKVSIKNADGTFTEKLDTVNRIIAMNAGAAGSGGKTSFFHGRYGSGITVQFDLTLVKLQVGGKKKNFMAVEL